MPTKKPNLSVNRSNRETNQSNNPIPLRIRASRLSINRLDTIRHGSPLESRSSVLRRLIELEYRRVYGDPVKADLESPIKTQINVGGQRSTQHQTNVLKNPKESKRSI